MNRGRFAKILRSEGITNERVIEQAWQSRPTSKFTESALREQCRMNLREHMLRIADQTRKDNHEHGNEENKEG